MEYKNNIIILSKELKSLKEKKSELKQQLKDLESEIKVSTSELVGIMDESEIRSIKIDDVGNVIQTQTHRANPVDKGLLFEYLEKNNLSGVITKTVHARTLWGLSKQYVEDNGKDLPGCKSYVEQSITIRKA